MITNYPDFSAHEGGGDNLPPDPAWNKPPKATPHLESLPNAMLHRTQVVYAGRVQGVGFRATARAAAAGHEVTGRVQNLPDDTVVLEVQGEPTAVTAYLADLRGRMKRHIARETATTIAVLQGESDFRIDH